MPSRGRRRGRGCARKAHASVARVRVELGGLERALGRTGVVVRAQGFPEEGGERGAGEGVRGERQRGGGGRGGTQPGRGFHLARGMTGRRRSAPEHNLEAAGLNLARVVGTLRLKRLAARHALGVHRDSGRALRGGGNGGCVSASDVGEEATRLGKMRRRERRARARGRRSGANGDSTNLLAARVEGCVPRRPATTRRACAARTNSDAPRAGRARTAAPPCFENFVPPNRRHSPVA